MSCPVGRPAHGQYTVDPPLLWRQLASCRPRPVANPEAGARVGEVGQDMDALAFTDPDDPVRRPRERLDFIIEIPLDDMRALRSGPTVPVGKLWRVFGLGGVHEGAAGGDGAFKTSGLGWAQAVSTAAAAGSRSL